MKEFKSFYKTVLGNEGQKCHYATRLDTYGCGCFHDCKYCYAKSLLDFRNLWNPDSPSIADIEKIEDKIKTIKKGTVLRLGGMTDCFQPCEKKYKITYKTIQLLNKYGIHYLIVTKSDLVASDEYIAVMNRDLAHIQITVTSTDDELAASYERATPPSRRIAAIEKLEKLGFDVQIRLSPFIPEYLNFDIINNIDCSKVIVEFLRVNAFIKRMFNTIDYSRYTHKEGGYYHLPLNNKIHLLQQITGFQELSVCEDCTDAYNYWKDNLNFNKNDCCNLKFHNRDKKKYPLYFGNGELLNLPTVAFLCSTNANEITKKKSIEWTIQQVRNGICIISGFQSPIEQAVLKTILKKGGQAIMVLAESLQEKYLKKYQDEIESNKLLIVSYFNDAERKLTRERAAIRNAKVIEIAQNVVVGYVKPSGMLEKLINKTSKACFVLNDK